MANMNRVKAVIDRYITNAKCGIYNTRNIVGDTMETIYNDGDVQIDICWYWAYFEVFGLSEEQFYELKKHYEARLKVVE